MQETIIFPPDPDNNNNWTLTDHDAPIEDVVSEEVVWVYEQGYIVQITFISPPANSVKIGNRVAFFDSDITIENNTLPKEARPKFSGIIKEVLPNTENPRNTTANVELTTELHVASTGNPARPDRDTLQTNYKVVTFTTPHIGRRGKIVIAVKQALERIRQGDPVGRRIAWLPDTGERYPVSINCVLLEPLQPINLDRDNLLPAIIVSYGDGIRDYKARRRANNSQRDSSYNTLNEVEENMTVMLRVILQANLEATRELAEQGVLTGESLTITTANIHEAIDTALGDGLDLAFNGERIEGIRSLRVMRWQTPFDMWANDYAILDIPVIITHVFHRGTGV